MNRDYQERLRWQYPETATRLFFIYHYEQLTTALRAPCA
jgi:hypothetical protein